MPRSSSGYTVSISRSYQDPAWVRVTMRKQWWSVDKGTTSRPVAEAGFWAGEAAESTLIESALRELLRAYVDDLDRP